jgi:hypothetical protein
VWDDAIESEGANMNVRIWGNYMHRFFNGIASASTSRGPLYCFRNVMGESRTGHRNSKGGTAFKLGDQAQFTGGKRFIFHNTVLQPDGVLDAFCDFRMRPNGVMSRNNIFDVSGRLFADRENEPQSDLDYDYFSGMVKGIAREEHGIRISETPASTRLFVESYRLEFYPRLTINAIKWGSQPYDFGDRHRNVTDPVIWATNPMIDGGTMLPNFSDNFIGKAPDVGAFEVGAPPLEFGRRAYLKYNEGWCAWEKY